MLEQLEEILLEQYISCENLKKDERNNCVHFIRNLKDISDSNYFIDEVDDRKYDIVSIHFIKKGNKVNFNGSVGNNREYRWIDGNITRRGKSIVVMCNFYRLSQLVSDADKQYSTVDVYNSTRDGIMRKSAYVHDDSFSVDSVNFDDHELEDFYRKLINPEHGKKLHN